MRFATVIFALGSAMVAQDVGATPESQSAGTRSPGPPLPGTPSSPTPSPEFTRDVAPLLQQHCVRCHGPEKQKGDLRLDRRDGLFPADAERWVVQPREPQHSELLRRLQLPPDDDEVMPQDADPLPAAAVDRIGRWIAAGADWPDDGDAWFVAAAARAQPRLLTFDLPALDPTQRAAVDAALQHWQERGGSAHPVATTSAAVAVRALARGRALDDGDRQALLALAPVLVWLDLSSAALQAADLPVLGALRQLRRLQLAGCVVGADAVTALRSLEHLEVLNAVDSGIGDAELRVLAASPALRRVYAGGAAVTAAGVAAAVALHPGLVVDRGEEAAARMQAAAVEIAGRGAAARPVNATCPITGEPVDPTVTTAHDGLLLAFCCERCRERFRGDPAAFAAAIGRYRAGAAEGK